MADGQYDVYNAVPFILCLVMLVAKAHPCYTSVHSVCTGFFPTKPKNVHESSTTHQLSV